MNTKKYLKKRLKPKSLFLTPVKMHYSLDYEKRHDTLKSDTKLPISSHLLKILCLLLCLMISVTLICVAKMISTYLYKNAARDLNSLDPNSIPDYAMASAGAVILGQPTAHHYDNRLLKIGWLTLFHWSDEPDLTKPSSILKSAKSPGECWAFAGSKATIFIKLSHTIVPRAVTIDHIPREISPAGHIASALKLFSIYTVEEEGVRGVHLGTFTYQSDGEASQTFFFNHYTYPVNIIQFAIHSNHGHHLYTCVYKIRVHGDVYYI